VEGARFKTSRHSRIKAHACAYADQQAWTEALLQNSRIAYADESLRALLYRTET
jgi:hypothetical protein